MKSGPRNAALILHPHLLRRKALRHLLLRLGFTRIHEAEDAVSAAALASQELVDVAFVPWSAGGRAGAELFALLRPRGHKAAPAIVVLDEDLPRASAVAAVKAGAAGRLALPATEADVARLLASLAEVSGLDDAPGGRGAGARRD